MPSSQHPQPLRPAQGDCSSASRRLGILSAVVLAVMFIGCMSFTVGGRTYQQASHEGTGADGLFVQENQLHLPPGGEQDVYYAVPYAHPPNLVLIDNNDDCILIDQQADHFRVHNKSLFGQDVAWRARGLRLPAGEVPTATLPTLPVPASPG